MEVMLARRVRYHSAQANWYRSLYYSFIDLILILSIVFGYVPGVSAMAVRSASAESFKVSGNRIMTATGRAFIAEGISVYGGLEDTYYMENIPNINAQIEASAQYWHTNTIRLQVSESNLFRGLRPKQPYNIKFLNELIREVNLARHLNQIVVINDQTEFTSNVPGPTATTVKFWQVMVHTFGKRPYIIFDLFNEPRLESLNMSQPQSSRRLGLTVMQTRRTLLKRTSTRHRPISSQTVWNIWKYGGYINGTTYVGMQTLINMIRARGANNLIWAEGPYWAQRLPSHQYLLTGDNVVYAYHHINLNNPASWQTIKTFASAHAVVNGEWAQYQSPWAECYEDAPITAPLYLKFLKTNSIGLVAWSLQAGSLVAGSPFVIPTNRNSINDPFQSDQLQTPSRFTTSYECNNDYGQGAGQLIMRYFDENSVPI